MKMSPENCQLFALWKYAYLTDPQQRGVRAIWEEGFKDIITYNRARHWSQQYKLTALRKAQFNQSPLPDAEVAKFNYRTFRERQLRRHTSAIDQLWSGYTQKIQDLSHESVHSLREGLVVHGKMIDMMVTDSEREMVAIPEDTNQQAFDPKSLSEFSGDLSRFDELAKQITQNNIASNRQFHDAKTQANKTPKQREKELMLELAKVRKELQPEEEESEPEKAAGGS